MTDELLNDMLDWVKNEKRDLLIQELNNWLGKEIKEVQNGHFGRDDFPTGMIAQIAQENWYLPLFSYGMEYGLLLGMVRLRNKLKDMK